MITLISREQPQYKANLHSHSNLSDGVKTPAELKEMYQSHGYSILSITDHERPADHSDLNDPDFLLLTGYEVYIRSDEQYRYDYYQPEIHMNLFARDPHFTGHVGYELRAAKYLPEEEREKVVPVGDGLIPRVYSVEYINRFIAEAKKNGYLVAYNHPVWSLEDYADILAYRGFFSMEMCNYSAYLLNGLPEYNSALYDQLLRHGIRLGVHGGDDNHNRHTAPDEEQYNDSFGSFTYILADGLEYGKVIDALDRGNFYFSMGPQFREITVEGDRVTVRTSPVDRIAMLDGGKRKQIKIAGQGEKITEAAFTIGERAPYIRFHADDGVKNADTRAYFKEEFTE